MAIIHVRMECIHTAHSRMHHSCSASQHRPPNQHCGLSSISYGRGWHGRTCIMLLTHAAVTMPAVRCMGHVAWGSAAL